MYLTQKKRGLYRSRDGQLINADLNGSMNIMRKYMTNNNSWSDEIYNSLLERINNIKRVNINY